MKPEKHSMKNTYQELADGIIFPITLTSAQQKGASDQLAEARKKGQQEMAESDRLPLTVLQQKFQEEDFGRSDKNRS